MKTLLKDFSKKALICTSLFLIFFACQKNKSIRFDENLINKISDENKELPSQFSSNIFFGKCSNNKIAEVYIQDLKAINKFKFPTLSYKDFLQKALNQKIAIDYEDKIKCFDLDTQIRLSYKSNDFNTFLNQYTEKVEGKKLLLKKSINEKQLNSVLYYFFLNNYLSSYDDYIDRYYIIKTSGFY